MFTACLKVNGAFNTLFLDEPQKVFYDLSNQKTRSREIEGAVAAAKALKLKHAKILTYAESDEVRHSSGVVVDIMPVPEWAVRAKQMTMIFQELCDCEYGFYRLLSLGHLGVVWVRT